MPPGILSFRSPLSKINRNGTLSILNFEARFWLASMFNLPTLTLPLDSTPNWSIIGATAPQLGHQDAQANKSTGRGDFSTLSSKFASVTMIGWGANSSSVASADLHLPHFAPALSLPAGTLFLAPHWVQRILKLSSGRALLLFLYSSSWHFPLLAVMPTRLAGLRLPAPHPGQLIMYDSACAIIVRAPIVIKFFYIIMSLEQMSKDREQVTEDIRQKTETRKLLMVCYSPRNPKLATCNKQSGLQCFFFSAHFRAKL